MVNMIPRVKELWYMSLNDEVLAKGNNKKALIRKALFNTQNLSILQL